MEQFTGCAFELTSYLNASRGVWLSVPLLHLQTALISPSPPILEVFLVATLAHATAFSLLLHTWKNAEQKNDIPLK